MPYNPAFIDGYRIPMPGNMPVDNIPPDPLEYHHHSIIMNMQRKFAYLSASNTDGESWDPIERKGSFRKDSNLDAGNQLGDELYGSITRSRGRGNDFDEGHLTSYQEVLWGKGDDFQQAGNDTFYYTNCVPQHASLNRGAWKSLEQFLIKQAADPNEIRINVLTGPVMLPSDPYFINVVNGDYIQIPVAFWKVIYYKAVEGLSAVGFMMSHRDLLLDDGTITYNKKDVQERGMEPVEDIFMHFPKATTYQVNVDFIEKITALNFFKRGVRLPYDKRDTREVIYKRIEVPATRGDSPPPESFMDEVMDYRLDNLSF